MNIAVDIGNSLIKVVFFKKDKVEFENNVINFKNSKEFLKFFKNSKVKDGVFIPTAKRIPESVFKKKI